MSNQRTIEVKLSHGGDVLPVQVPEGSDAGHIRSLVDILEELGAPSNYNLGLNGTAVSNDTKLTHGDTVTFRPVTGSKG